MRIVEAVTLETPADPWLSLGALSEYSGLSVRSLRAYVADPHRPLPHYRMKEPHVIATKTGRPHTVTGKILVRRSDFDAWMQAFRYVPDLDKLVDEVVSEIRR
jgi:hypothetical protein